MAEPAAGFRLDVGQPNYAKDREQRRAQQEAYRRDLNSQVADAAQRREQNERRIRELEEKHEVKSVSLVVRNKILISKLEECAAASESLGEKTDKTASIALHVRVPCIRTTNGQMGNTSLVRAAGTPL